MEFIINGLTQFLAKEIKFILWSFVILFFVSCVPAGKTVPQISGVTPSQGPLSGGTLITISGSNLRYVNSVSVGGNPCIVQSLASTEITCLTPAKTVGSYNVEVITQNKVGATFPSGFTYYKPATLTSISPSSGISTGGTAVMISGNGFESGASVNFGSSACINVNVINSTTISCTTSAHAAGGVSVTVTNANGQIVTGAGYLFRGPPTVTGISPNGGPFAGNTVVTISGSGFYSGISVNFGGATCSNVVIVDPSTLTCTTSAHVAGSVLTTVTNQDSQTGSGNYFTYEIAPTVASVSPNFGGLAGGTTVTITGSYFISGAIASVGGVACGTTGFVNSTTLTCTTPTRATIGLTDIVVKNPDTQYGTLSNAFTYYAPPTVTSISPATGFASGATSVTINGTGFRTGLIASIGGSTCTTPTFVNSTKMTCTTTAHAAGATTVSVTNTDDNQTGTSTSALYTYWAAPTVAAISPAFDKITGGKTVTITGTGFYSGAAVDIGGSACTVLTLNATTITCTTTANAAAIYDVKVTNSDTQFGTKTNAFTYQGPPTLASVTANNGPMAGGNIVTVTGNNFVGTTVTFGGKACPVVSLFSTSLTCTVPLSLVAGNVDVVATNSDGQNVTLATAYLYIPAPTITSVSPNVGALAGGNLVTISGTNFLSPTVTIGGATCSVTALAATITCTVPDGTAHGLGSADVVVTNSDGQFVTKTGGYTYQAAPTVSSVANTAGPLAGGNTVTITGTGFLTGASVTFGGVACPNTTLVSSTSMTCKPASHAAGPVDVVVTNTDGQTGTGTNIYTYQAAPTVTSLSATSDKTSGGLSVTITGTGFVTGAAVNFGGSACSVTASTPPTSITCTTPAHAAGVVAVTVTNSNDNQSGSLAAAFTFIPPPTITTISLNAGILTGGNSVTITGTGFLTGVTLTIAGVSCPVTASTLPTSITCTVPDGTAHGLGSADVVVTNTDTQTATKTNGYTYQNAPTVTSVAFNAGALAGGTNVIVTGTGFLNGASVDFGGSACNNVIVGSLTSITCTTSAHAAGAVAVKVTNADTQFGSAAGAYKYQAAPAITSVSPSSGPLAGGTLITITGSGFLTGATATVAGLNCTNFTLVSATTITCKTQAHVAALADVVVTNVDAQTGTKASSFLYIPAPSITSLSQTSGTPFGGTILILTGTNFLSGATITFGGTNCTSVIFISSTSISCTTPAHAAGVVDVIITNPDTQSYTNTNSFTFVSKSNLQWLTTSPRPPNPDPYGTLSVNTTHTYTLKNTGDISSTAISMSFTGASSGAWILGSDNCTGNTLAPGATCTVQAIFMAQFLATGSYSANIVATDTMSTTSNTMTGSVP